MPEKTVRIRGTARGKPIESIETNARRLPEDYPFPIGSVVKLKSGGVEMTVVGIINTCAERGAIVEVIWSAPHFDQKLWRDQLPRQCLMSAIEDNMPF